MDYSDILRSQNIDIDNEYSIIYSLLTDKFYIKDIRMILDANFHIYPFSEGSISYRELLMKIDNLKMDTSLKFIYLGQAICNIFNFAYNSLENARLSWSRTISISDNSTAKTILNKIFYISDRLGYELIEIKQNRNKKVIAMQKNDLAKSVSKDTANIELSNSIFKYNFIDSNFETKLGIIFVFYRYFDKNKEVISQVNDATNGIKRTYKNLLRIMETLKHGDKHPQSLKFILEDKDKWTDIAYNLSLEVFRHLLNREYNLSFEKSLMIEES